MSSSRNFAVPMALAIPAALAACAASNTGGGGLCPRRHAVVREDAMSCAEVNRVSIEAVKRLGYTIREYSPAKPGQPGRIAATWTDGYSSNDAHVTVTCSGAGAEVDAVTTRGCAGQMRFPNDFRENFARAMARKVEPPSIESRHALKGVQITVEPKRGGDPALGANLEAAGLMPVKVTITNRTARTYVLDVGKVVLLSQDGARVHGLPPEEAVAWLARTPEGQGGFRAAEQVRSMALASGTIEPDDSVAGFLYVPRQAYHRARVTLTDREAEEDEGFAVEF